MNNGFEQAIGRYLDGLAAIDGMFASVYKSKGKDIPDCCNFIIAEVKKTKRVGFADEEIYGMAKHYFEEALRLVETNKFGFGSGRFWYLVWLDLIHEDGDTEKYLGFSEPASRDLE